MKLYIFNLLVGIDQLCNCLLGGSPDETISSRCYKHSEHWAANLAVKLIDFLFMWYEKDHCRKAFEGGDRQLEEVWK